MAQGVNERIPCETSPPAPATRCEHCHTAAQLQTLEPLCFDHLLSFLDLRDFCALSSVSRSLRATLLTDLSRAGRCVSCLAVHCLCDTPVHPPLGVLRHARSLDSVLPLSVGSTTLKSDTVLLPENTRGETYLVDPTLPSYRLPERFLPHDEGSSFTIESGASFCRAAPTQGNCGSDKNAEVLSVPECRPLGPRTLTAPSSAPPQGITICSKPVGGSVEEGSGEGRFSGGCVGGPGESSPAPLVAPCEVPEATVDPSRSRILSDTQAAPLHGWWSFSDEASGCSQLCAVPLWKAFLLVAKGLSVLRVGPPAFGAVPLALWGHLLRENAATLREISVSSTLRWESRRQQQRRQRALLDLLCRLESPSSDIQAALASASRFLPPIPSRPDSPPSSLFPKGRPPRSEHSECTGGEQETGRCVSHSAAIQACRSLSRPCEDILLPALKSLAIAWGPCSGLLQLFRRYTCRQCEELQLVVADMPTATCWSDAVESVLDRVGNGGKLRRFRFAVAPKGFVQERSLICWLLPSAEDADGRIDSRRHPPEVPNASWLAALEELSIDTDDPWLLPKAAQLIAAVTRPSGQPAGLAGPRPPGGTGPAPRGEGAAPSGDPRETLWGSMGTPDGVTARRGLRNVSEISESGAGAERLGGGVCSAAVTGNAATSKGRRVRHRSCGLLERRQVRGKSDGQEAERSPHADAHQAAQRRLSGVETRSESPGAAACAFRQTPCGRVEHLDSGRDETGPQTVSRASGEEGRSAVSLQNSRPVSRTLRDVDDEVRSEMSSSCVLRFPSLRVCSFRCGSVPAAGAGCFSWDSVESLLASAPAGCALRFHGDILFTTCSYGPCRFLASSVSPSRSPVGPTVNPAEHERRSSCSRGRVNSSRTVAGRDSARPSSPPHWEPFLDASLPAQRSASTRQGLLCAPPRREEHPRQRQLFPGCRVADRRPQICVKSATVVLQEIRGEASLDSLLSPAFHAPLRLCCVRRKAATASGRDTKRIERRSASRVHCVRGDQTRRESQGCTQGETPAGGCRDVRFRAHLEVPFLPKSSGWGSQVADASSHRRCAYAQTTKAWCGSGNVSCPPEPSLLPTGRALFGSESGKGFRPKLLFPAVQVQLASPVEAGPSLSPSRPETSPSQSAELEDAYVEGGGEQPLRKSTQVPAWPGADGLGATVSRLEEKHSQRRPRQHRLPEWRLWCAEYLSGILDELPGYCLFFPPVAPFPTGAAHGCGALDAAPRSENDACVGAHSDVRGAHSDVRGATARDQGGALRGRHDSPFDREPSGRAKTGWQCCCVFSQGERGDERGTEGSRCVFTLHRRGSRGERRSERSRNPIVGSENGRTWATWPLEGEGDRQPSGGLGEPFRVSISEIGDSQPDSVALLTALCLDAESRQRFRGIALECIFSAAQPAASSADRSARASDISCVEIAAECLAPVQMLLERLPDSLRPPLEILRLFVDATATEDAVVANPRSCISGPIRTVSPTSLDGYRIPADVCVAQQEKEDGSVSLPARLIERRATEGEHDNFKKPPASGCVASQAYDPDGARGGREVHAPGSRSARSVPEGGEDDHSAQGKTVTSHSRRAVEDGRGKRQQLSKKAVLEACRRSEDLSLSDAATCRDCFSLARTTCVQADESTALLFPCADTAGKGYGSLVSLLFALRRVYTDLNRVEVRVLRGDPPGTKFAAWKLATVEGTEASDCWSCLVSNSARLRALHQVLVFFQFYPACVWHGQYVFETFVAYVRDG
ncbi:putative F-box domain-containing protein [Neospora caninum Liverpool]|uniref:F-box domain-containing protein, putative n=1 Tax=Neospora caninum (strain Liverpool) TaxID=572307 RepID=F0VLE7_NEOCL|nr:putative F-box domain-containing protein [Neospora caninum Liverpool]CBZ54075.1 putative F-box domain-containing protein [Neospora caninum Liverpool]CEL68771.1 TPA: F-box domain-containing protein, putative [Neospora caninum Liverpool]|eukprot:XP_003884106.1 putative F-box domain-containing protein [Neospora caninum Liverpool]